VFIQTGLGAHPASYAFGTGSFPGVNRRGCGVIHPPTPIVGVKERVELYFYPHCALMDIGILGAKPQVSLSLLRCTVP